jgi:vacuolar-type H+-ATPase subunit E/Vma4
MVNKEIVIETIKKMYDSGIDDSVVEQTLKDIGLAQGEIKAFIAEARSGAAPAEEAPPGRAMNQTVELIKRHIDETHEAQEAMHSTTQAALEEHGARVDAVHERVGAVEERLGAIASGPSNQQLQDSIVALNVKIAGMDQQVRDLKSSVNATKSVMEKVLETCREILNKL